MGSEFIQFLLMSTRNSIMGWSVHRDCNWIVERIQLERIRLKSFELRDMIEEPYHRYGKTKVYFWHHMTEDHCTVRVDVTVTESNDAAHKLMDVFSGSLSDVTRIKALAPKKRKPWSDHKHLENIQVVESGDDQHLAALIWGNVFVHVASVGEMNHSISEFLESLHEHWGEEKKRVKPALRLIQRSKGMKFEVARDSSLNAMYAVIIKSGPKKYATLKRQRDGVYLEHDSNWTGNVKPYIQAIAVHPDGAVTEGSRVLLD